MSRPASVEPPGLLARVSLRGRVTFWVLAIFVVVHLTLSLVMILFDRRGVEDRLAGELNAAIEIAMAHPEGTTPLGLIRAVSEHHGLVDRVPVRVSVIAEDGTVFSTPGRPAPDWERILASQPMPGSGTERPRLRRSPRDSIVFIVRPLADGGTIVASVSRAVVDAAVRPFVLALLFSLATGIFACGLATWFMAGVAIRPLEQVREFADAMSADSLPKDIDLDETAPEVLELRDRLEAAMQRISEGYDRQARFLANVSHELKTPISVVRTEAEVLLAGRATEDDLRRFARSSSEEMSRLGKMVESFLLLTRIRHGSARIRPARLNSNDLLMDVVAQCAGMALQYGVRLSPELDPSDPPPEVRGNPDLLQTALGNLVRNAIRFAPEGSHIDIACASDDATVSLSVRDYGPGIPDELISRIFEAFTQAKEERQRGRGTGLGLQIAQGIAELHGGHIEVANQDPGCRFTIKVPRSPTHTRPQR